MKQARFLVLVLTATMLFAACGKEENKVKDNIYQFKVLDGQGDSVSLATYEGQVLLVVNTATQCGYTPQYEDLERIYETYRDQGFTILDFPCNQFGGQASPATSSAAKLPAPTTTSTTSAPVPIISPSPSSPKSTSTAPMPRPSMCGLRKRNPATFLGTSPSSSSTAKATWCRVLATTLR